MEQRENQKQQSLFHGKFTHLVLSVSVFSLLFSRSYCLSLLHYCFTLNLYDTLPFQLFSHNIDKNCMFLLCNGLLVFLAKFSGFIGSSKHNNLRVLDHHDDDGDRSFKSFDDVPRFDQSIALDPKAPLLQKDEALRNGTSMEETHEEDQEEDGEKWGLDILMENGDFVEEDEDSKVLSTDDELNKRFDEFIRKMKEKLMIEARRQLVMV